MKRGYRQALLLSLSGAIATTLIACSSDPWSSKATNDEKAASQRVGQFSSDDQRLYHNGRLHIANVHQRIGSYTIGQVIDQERQREENAEKKRVADQQSAEKQRVAAEKRSADARETSSRSRVNAGTRIFDQARKYCLITAFVPWCIKLGTATVR